MSRLAVSAKPEVRSIDFVLPIPQKIIVVFAVPLFILYAYLSLLVPNLFSEEFHFVSVENLGIWAILGGGPAIIYLNSSGYRIAWDDEKVYMRDWGFRNFLLQRKEFHAIAFDDIQSMEGKFRSLANTKSLFMPFEYLEIKSRRRTDKDIWIYPLSLDHRGLSDFLAYLYSVRADAVPTPIVEQMRRDGLISS